MKRTFKLHITIKDENITYSMELDRDNTVTTFHAWRETDGTIRLYNSWQRDPTFLERVGRKILGFYRVMVAKVRMV